MHPRNVYQSAPDFAALADSYEPLRPYLISEPGAHRKTIDFRDAEAQRRLTEAIMFRDFGVTLHIPLNRLCPPVPNRLNYVLWIQDIVYAHSSILEPSPRVIRGIDIGTGATAIYPFLACKLESEWRMVGTELDEESYLSAQRNISINGMESRIDIRKACTDRPILFPLEDSVHYDFTMCNPPFYFSAQEVTDLAEEKELPPNAVCTGADIEMIYPDGGEAGFVQKMVEESVGFQTKCKWYTSMLGKMSSVLSIVDLLRQHSITNYAITEFVQGQTRRWAIAWSFADTHLPDVRRSFSLPADHGPLPSLTRSIYLPSQSVARISSIFTTHALYPMLPPRNTLLQPFACALAVLHEVLDETIRSLDLEGVVVMPSRNAKDVPNTDVLSPFLVEAQANTWSRSARRGRKRQAQSEMDGATLSQSVPGSTATVSSNPALTCGIRTVAQNGFVEKAGYGSVEFQWIFGRERGLFESFTNHVSRKVGTKVQARSS